MAYDVKVVPTSVVSEVYDSCRSGRFYSSKADISGVCVKLVTASKSDLDMWVDNFRSMSDSVRSHAMVICLQDDSRGLEVDYDPVTSIAVLYNFDYYGWIKSIALAIVSDILEDSHRIFAVHGAALDLDGRGVAIIAPSKTGKTTQSWGLLRTRNASLVTDDWFFVRLTGGRPRASGSEKNCYIDADIGDVWEEYRPLVATTRFDGRGRGIANIRGVKGPDAVVDQTSVSDIVLLKRDPSDGEVVRELTSEQALDYLAANDFCNPHQMIRDDRKHQLRMRFFERFLSGCRVHLVNTVLSPEETQQAIRGALGARE